MRFAAAVKKTLDRAATAKILLWPLDCVCVQVVNPSSRCEKLHAGQSRSAGFV
jgi:hypothetical protein